MNHFCTLDSKLKFDIFLAVITLLYIVIFALTPMSFDDYTYSLGTVSVDSTLDKVALMWQICKNHWSYDTGRLCNLLSPVFLGVFPKLVFSIISGIFIWISIRLMCLLAEVKCGSTGSWIIVLLVTFALPWFDYMFSVIFAINYVWPSALTLLIVYWLLNWNLVKTKLTTKRFMAMCGVALLTGWMHEGFSVPAIAGLSAVLALKKRLPERREMILLMFYIAGALLIVVSPALWVRTSTAESLFIRMSLFERIIHGIGFNILFFIFGIFLVISCFRHNFRDRLKENLKLRELILFVAISSTVATLIYYIFYTGPRMSWYATQFCSVGLVALIRSECRPFKRLVGCVVNYLIAILVATNLIAAVVEQNELYCENKDIVGLFLNSPNGEVYYDNIPVHISLSLLKPSMRNFNEYLPMKLFSEYWRKDENLMLSLLPLGLKNFAPNKASVCHSDSTLYLKDGLLLSRDPLPAGYSKILISTLEYGWVESRLRTRSFTANDGSVWILIVPHFTVMTGCTVTDAKWKEEVR